MLEHRQLQQVPPNEQHAHQLLERAQQSLAVAEFASSNGYLFNAVTEAWEAARKALTAPLTWQGLRPTTEGGHQVVIDAATQRPRVPHRRRCCRERGSGRPARRGARHRCGGPAPSATRAQRLPLTALRLHSRDEQPPQLGLKRGLEDLVAAARLASAPVRVVLMGDGSQRLLLEHSFGRDDVPRAPAVPGC